MESRLQLDPKGVSKTENTMNAAVRILLFQKKSLLPLIEITLHAEKLLSLCNAWPKRR